MSRPGRSRPAACTDSERSRRICARGAPDAERPHRACARTPGLTSFLARGSMRESCAFLWALFRAFTKRDCWIPTLRHRPAVASMPRSLSVWAKRTFKPTLRKIALTLCAAGELRGIRHVFLEILKRRRRRHRASAIAHGGKFSTIQSVFPVAVCAKSSMCCDGATSGC